MIVIEHHQAVMANADWIIDLGPGAGSDGGRVVFEGPPRALVDAADTLTAHHLRSYVAEDERGRYSRRPGRPAARGPI